MAYKYAAAHLLCDGLRRAAVAVRLFVMRFPRRLAAQILWYVGLLVFGVSLGLFLFSVGIQGMDGAGAGVSQEEYRASQEQLGQIALLLGGGMIGGLGMIAGGFWYWFGKPKNAAS